MAVGNDTKFAPTTLGDGARPAAATALRIHAASESIVVTYRREYRRCGRSLCHVCADGPGHGPAWHASWWQDGRLHTRPIARGWHLASEDDAE